MVGVLYEEFPFLHIVNKAVINWCPMLERARVADTHFDLLF